jgi:hypothetical protein
MDEDVEDPYLAIHTVELDQNQINNNTFFHKMRGTSALKESVLSREKTETPLLRFSETIIPQTFTC